MGAKERIFAGFMTGAMAFTMASCQIEGQEPTIVNPTSVSVETTTKNNNELKDVAPERLEFTKDLLNLYDESSKGGPTPFSKIKDFISGDQIIKYGESGETGENLSIIKHKDGSPAVALINCNDNVIGVFKEAINELIKYDPNFLEKMTDHGMKAFMVNRFDKSIGDVYTFNKSGLIVWNLENPDGKIRGRLERPIATECFGIKMYNLGGDYTKYVGFLKEQLGSDCWWNLYKKNGEEFCKNTSYSNYIFCKTYYNEFYKPVNFKDEKIQDLIKSARKLVSLFGGTESEISASIVDRPDWNSGDIE